ncbi:24190_t:CDS:2, partial [Racocetra persica]
KIKSTFRATFQPPSRTSLVEFLLGTYAPVFLRFVLMWSMVHGSEDQERALFQHIPEIKKVL